MTETTPAKNVGRNDKCPCGSGKKYKKCCLQANKLKQEATKTSRSAADLIDRETTSWSFYKLLRDGSSQNLLNFLYDLTAESGPFRKRLPTPESFFKAVSNGDMRAFASKGFDLLRIRHDDDQTLILLVRGLDNKQTNTLSFELFRLKDTGEGLRIWDVEFFEKAKSEVGSNPTFAELGVAWSWT